MNKLCKIDIQPDFILIDGDHSAEGVKKDIETILNMQITKPLTILMHDSLNPDCRRGMLSVDYANSPYVKEVEIDFIHGIFSPSEFTNKEMWGGFGKIFLTQEIRVSPLNISQSSNYSFDSLFSVSLHKHRSAIGVNQRIKSFIFRKFFN